MSDKHIVGTYMDEQALIQMRSALSAALFARLQEFYDVIGKEGSGFSLKRTAYTGDYTLIGHSPQVANFPVAKFGILPMPGCKLVAIFHHVNIEPEFRGRGLGKMLLKVRQEAAKTCGYTLAIATVRDDNEIEKHLLREAGWAAPIAFPNQKREFVMLWRKHL